MSRPTVKRNTRRVQVEMPVNTPGLDVVAPIGERVSTADADSWGRLMNALSVVAPVAAQRQSEIDKRSRADALADAQFGRVDEARRAQEDVYADGVLEYTYLEQFRQARSAVLERAESELDQTLDVEQKTAWIDAQMAEELKGLEDDPEFRRVVAPRYGEFINGFADGEITATLKENAAQAADGEASAIQEALDAGTFSYVESHARLSKVLGRSTATEQLVEIVAQQAVSRSDASVLDLLPSKIAVADGQEIDGPRMTPRHRARIDLAAAQIEKARKEALGPQLQWEEAQARRGFEDRILNTLPISLAETEPYVKKGLFTPEYANSLVNRAAAAMEEKKKKDDKWDLQFGLFRQTGTGSWVDTVGLPDGPENMKDAQELTDESFRRDLTGLAQGIMAAGDTNLARVPLSGPEISQIEGVSDELFYLSKGYRLPYTPMKAYMSEITPAQPDGVLARLPMYEKAKAAGVAPLYVTPETEAVFEVALSAKRAGEKDETIKETLRRTADPAMRAYVAENRAAVHKAAVRDSYDVVNAWRDADVKDAANLPLVQAKLRALGETYLARGIPPAQASALAAQRFGETHFAVKVGGRVLFVPESGEYDSAAAAAALEEMQKAAAVFAKAQGDSDPDSASIVIDFGVGGRGVEVFFQGSDGAQLNTHPFTIPSMIRAYRKKKSAADYDAAIQRNRAKQDARRGGADRTRVQTSFSEAKWPM